ncbi:hypothetical protein [[Flexibacter] sp. ATCC 35208]|uniref:hypothetical protein n=1 Tax=[Flexibacter] sp. ATCC 35208 TaxID=1936242 RepID=UPI0009C4EE6B|nr:hypothetical protein [[Flexibacter] sp. ATCC 35208]OMP76510.1 hypothetical protein BW716_24655 [[Flexibacter] sp. ATCC 35208]
MAYNPTTIANYFITTYASEYVPINVNQLVGLTYFSYGWYLAFSEGRSTLIKEPLICHISCATFASLWENMIVSRRRYYYKKLPNPQGNQAISKEDQHLLDRVWNTYGHIGDNIIIKAFHNDVNNPWKKTLVTGQKIISMMQVYEYFKNKLIKADTHAV